MIRQVRRCLHHAPRVARGADATAFAGIGHEVVVPAVITPRPGKAVVKDAAFKVLAKGLADIRLGGVVVALAVELACVDSKAQSPPTTPELIATHAYFTGAGGIKALESRMQLLPRERVARLLDRGTPFLEISRLRVSPARQCRKNAPRLTPDR